MKNRREAARGDVLATPRTRPLRTQGLLGDRPGALIAEDAGTVQFHERVRALRDKYDLKGDELKGALKVALDYVPGFRVEPQARRVGAPMGWGPMRQYFLWHDVQVLRQSGLPPEQAYREAAALPQWRSTAVTLRRRFHAAKKTPFVVGMQRVIDRLGWSAYMYAWSDLNKPATRDELIEYERTLDADGLLRFAPA